MTANATLTIDAKVESAERAIAELAEQVDELERALKKASASTQKMDKVTQAAAKSATVAASEYGTALGKFRSIGDRLSSIAGRHGAADITALATSFTALQGAVGGAVAAVAAVGSKILEVGHATYQADQVFKNMAFSIAEAKESTHGLVGSLTLAKEANAAYRLGVVETSEEFAQLSADAVALGTSVGESAESSIHSAVVAIGRASPLLLDNLGITLTLAQAQKELASDYERAGKAFTAEAKASAFAVKAKEAIHEKAQLVRLSTTGAAAEIEKLNIKLQDLNEIGLASTERNTSLAFALEKLEKQGELNAGSADRVRERFSLYGAEVLQLKEKLAAAGVSSEDLKISQQNLASAVIAVVHAAERERAKIQETQLELAKAATDNAIIVGYRLAEQELGVRRAILQAGRDTADNREEILQLDYEILQNQKEQAKVAGDLMRVAEIDAQQRILMIPHRAGGRRGGGGAKQDIESLRHEVELRRELRALALEEATGVDGLGGRSGASRVDMIQRELAANQELYAWKLSHAKTQYDREQIQDQQAEAIHAARLGRIKAEQEETAKAQAFALEQHAAFEDSYARHRERLLELKLQAIEIEAAQGLDPLQVIDREMAANVEFYDWKIAHERDLEKVEDLRNKREDVLHKARLARLKIEQKQTKASAFDFVRIGEQMGESMLGFAANVVRASALQGQSVKDAVKTFAAQGALEMTLTTTLELIRAAVAAASYRYGDSAKHLANAAAAGATAAALTATYGVAGGFSRGVGNGDAGAFSGELGGPGVYGGASAAGRNAGTVNRNASSDIPGSPNASSAPTQGGSVSNASESRGVVFNGDVHLYGVPKDDFIKSVDNGLKHLGYNRRRESA